MPSTDRRLELKAKDIDGSDRLTAGCVCQWVNNIDCGFKWKEALNCVDWEITNQHDVQSQKTGILATLL
jgi:hypothetical protein